MRYREVSAKVRKQEATLFHLRWINANNEVDEADARARSRHARSRRRDAGADRSRPRSRNPSPRRCRRCAKTKRAPAAALQRLVIARETLDREEERARKERLAELEPRLAQLNDDIAREKQLATDSEWALERLAAEAAALHRDLRGRRDKRGAAMPASGWRKPTPCWPASEKMFGELTGALADLTARRNRSKARAREQAERLSPRFEREIAEVEAELAQARGRQPGSHDLARARSRCRSRASAVTEARSRGAARREPRIRRRVRRSTSRAVRLPKPSGAPTGSRPKPRRWQSAACRCREICGRR